MEYLQNKIFSINMDRDRPSRSRGYNHDEYDNYAKMIEISIPKGQWREDTVLEDDDIDDYLGEKSINELNYMIHYYNKNPIQNRDIISNVENYMSRLRSRSRSRTRSRTRNRSHSRTRNRSRSRPSGSCRN